MQTTSILSQTITIGLDYFFSLKNFSYIAKDANNLHLKSAITIGLATSQLPPLQNTPSPWPTYFK
jgi:hypothetical protein